MPALRFPLWFATERKVRATPYAPEPMLQAVLVFTRSEPLGKLLFGTGSGLWKIDLVANRVELLAMVADLHEREVRGVLLDSDGEGRGGETIPLSDLLAFADNVTH